MPKRRTAFRVALTLIAFCAVTAFALASVRTELAASLLSYLPDSTQPAGEIEQLKSVVPSPIGENRNNPNLMVGLSGVYNIPGDFADLSAAITSLNSNGVAGPVTLNLISGTPQTAPSGGYVIGGTGSLVLTTTSSTNTVTLLGNGNTITAPNPQTSGNLNDAIFKLIGADYVTIDGFTMQENPANTTTSPSNNMTEWGVALLYSTNTDGAQNDTIQNNTISLNRTYLNTFGVYSNSSHSATNVGNTANASGSGGPNNNLKVYGNNISNVNEGIAVVGPQIAADHITGLDIGGTSAATGNAISNYGSGTNSSAPVNVSTTVYGILIRNSTGFSVANNSITSSNGGVTVGILRGIYVPQFNNAPTGTFTNSINNNNISLTDGVSGTLEGIAVESQTGTATSTLNIDGNNFTAFTASVATSGTFAVISNAMAMLNTSISNNTFSNITTNTTGAFTFIKNTALIAATGSRMVNGNSIVGTFNKTGTGAASAVTFFTTQTNSPVGTTETNNNNNFSNVTVTGSTTVTGWENTDASVTAGASKTITGNTFSNIAGGTNPITGMSISSFGGSTVSNNVITNITSSGSITGVATGAGRDDFSQNTISTFSSTGNTINGFSLSGATSGISKNIFRNKIYSLESTNSGGLVNGIVISSVPTTLNIYNNLIGDLRAPSSSLTSESVRGIATTATTPTTAVNVSFNSIYLNATSTGTNFSTAGLYHSSISTTDTSALTLKDNIIINLSTPNGTGVTSAFRKTTTDLGNFVSSSNNNLYYAGVPAANRVILFEGANKYQTLSAYQTRVSPRDSAAVTENPPFLSTAGGNSSFLHINTLVQTQIESGGIPVSGITNDFDGDPRSVTMPDIGADEFVGTPIDVTGPAIGYTPLGNTAGTTNRDLTISVVDVASGVPSSGIGLPVIYYRKGASGAYNSSQCSFIAGSSFNCTINYALVSGGSVTTGDTIQYYVAAQDNSNNVSVNPSTGAGGLTANPPAAATPPSAPNSYNILSTLSGNKNVGSGGDYPTITAALDAVNNSEVSGPLTLTLTDSIYASETFPLTINANPGSSAVNTITIKPAAGVNASISGSSTSCILNLNGADWVTVDGSNNGTASRDLTLSATNDTNSAIVCLTSLGAGQGATNNTIKNLNLAGTIQIFSPGTQFGIFAGEASIGENSNGADNDNNTYQNNYITKAATGIYSGGEGAGNKNTGTVISQNVMNAGAGNNLVRGGILVKYDDGTQISRNDISVLRNDGSIPGSGPTGTAFGIALGVVPSVTVTAFGGADVTNASVTRNKINGITQLDTDGFSAFGIVVNSVSSGTTLVANNMVSGVISNATVPDFTAGIVAGGGSGSTTQIYYNSVSMTGNRGGATYPSYALAIGGSDPIVDVRDNAFLNTQTSSGGGSSYAIGTASSTFANLISDVNDLFVAGANGFVGHSGDLGPSGTDYLSLANWQGGTSRDASSISANPLFVSTTDLHLQASSPNIDTGTSVGGITVDFDGNTRPNGTAPDRGADELSGTPGISVTGGPLNFGNQLVGTTSGDMSLTVTNTGTGDLVMGTATFSLGASQYLFTANPTGTVVPPGQMTTISIAFKPTTRGAHPGTVVINSNAPVTAPQVSLSGTGVAPQVGLSTNSIAFGSQVVGTTSASMALTISNNGDAGQTLTINSLPIAGTNAGDFIITDAPALPADIAPGANITIHLTFTPGATGARSATLTVSNNDPLNSMPTVSLSGTGSALPGTIALSSATYSYSEGVGNATVTVTRTGGTNGAVGVSYSTSAGTATAGTCGNAGIDYQNTSGTLSWADGDGTAKTFNIAVCDDALVESNETVNIAITSPTGGATLGTPNTSVLTINDNDIPFDVTSVSPTDGATNVTRSTPISVIFNRAANPATVTTTGTTACVGSLQLSSDNFATCVPLGTPVASLGNTMFASTPSSPLSGSTVYKIRVTTTAQDTNGNPLVSQFTQANGFTTASAGTLSLSSATYSVGENGGNATITVTRTGGSDGAVGVSYSTADNTAIGGASCAGSVDYVTTSGTLSWTNGVGTAKTFNIPICDDAVFEGNETVNITLSSPTGGAAIDPIGSAVLTITDNETQPTFSIDDVTHAEGNSGTTSYVFTVTKTGSTALSTSVNYATANGTASQPTDYTSASGTLNFASGDTSKQVTVLVNGDTAVETDETFVVNLSGAVNAGISDSQGVGTITNDDDATLASDYFRTIASGNWNAASTWESSHDGVNNWISATLTPTSTANAITIRNGHTVTVTSAVSTDQTTVEAGGQISVSTGIAFSVADGPDAVDLSVSGTINNAGSIPTSGTVSFNSGSKYQHNFTISPGTIPTAAWNAGSTCEIVGYTSNTNPPSGIAQSFANFTWNNPNQSTNISFGGTVPTVTGQFTVQSTGTGSLRIAATTSPTFNVGSLILTGGTFIFSTSNGTPTINVAGEVTIGVGATLQPATSTGVPVFNVGGSWTNQGTFTTSSGAVTFNGAGSQTVTPGGTGAGKSFAGFVVNKPSGTLTLGGAVAASTLTIQSGTFDTSSVNNYAVTAGSVSIQAAGVFNSNASAISDTGNWSNTGTFNAGTGAVNLNGSGAQTVSGDTTFNDLSGTASVARTLTFEAGKTQAVSHSLTFSGTAGNLLSLRSSLSGTAWKLNAPAIQNVGFVNVQDSDASGGNLISAANSVNSGNNTNWTFPAPGAISLSSATYSVGEGGGMAVITVNRSGGTLGSVGISYLTANGTATGGASCGGSVDYVSASGTLSWANGDAAAKTFNIPVCDDAVFEGNETVNISITTPTGGAILGMPNTAVLTINDNDSAQPMATNLSAAETFTEDTSLNLIDIVVSDQDSASVTATLTLSSTSAGSLTTGTSGAVTSTYSPGTGVWSASGAIADVNVLLSGVNFVPAANFNSNFTIATSVTDGTTAPVTGTKSMTGTAVNDAPVLDATRTPILTAEVEDSPAPSGAVGTLVSSLVDFASPAGQVDNVTDVDSGALLGVAVTAANTSNGAWFYTINNGSTWTALGAVSDVSARLLAADANTRLYFVPNANFNGTITNAITFRAWDQTSGTNGTLAASTPNGGTTPFSLATDGADLTVTPVNDAPLATNLSAAESYTEDTPLNLTDIVVSDIDSPNVTTTLTLSNPSAGSLSTATSGAVTSTYVSGTGVWTATGPIANVNVLLAGVTFNPAANFNSNFTIATNVSDGSLSTGGTKAITGIAVNDAPTATNLSAVETYTEDTPLNLVDIVVSDVDSASVTATLTLSTPSAGSLSTGTSGAVTSTYVAGTGVWSASGAIANVNSLLAGVIFTPAANFNSNFTIATSVSDGSLSATGSKTMTGTAVNDAPAASNLSAAESYTEDTPLNLIDIVVSDVDNANTTATLTLSNPSAGSFNVATSGAVTSTYTPATGVWTASGNISNVNVLLAGLTFTPSANFNSNFSIATSVSDGSLSVTGSKSVTGVAVNDAPVLDVSRSPVLTSESQDSPAPAGVVGTAVSSLVDFAVPSGQVDNVTDVDAGALLGIAVTGADTTNGSWFYSINSGSTWTALGAVSDSSARLLAADANSRLYFQPNAGFSGTIANAITFRAWDQTSGTNGSLTAATPNGGTTAYSAASDSASITINSVSSGTMEFSAAAYAGIEGTSVTVTVNRSVSTGSTSIHFATSNGTATAGTCVSGNGDYIANSGDLSFNAGETSKTFMVNLCTDSLSETPAETINLTLTGAVGAQSTATISIFDAATQYINNTPLTFSPGGAAVSSQITTSSANAMSGVRVTLFGVTAPLSDNVDVLLVSPSGATYVLMGDVGGPNALNNQTITIEDIAPTFMPDSTAIPFGMNFRPTTCGGAEHAFGGGAPPGPYDQPGCGPTFTTTLGSVFGNTSPNGNWTLYARDDSGVDPLGTTTNTIAGWGLQLLAPTAAPASISGRVLTASGQGIRNATVSIWGGNLPQPVTVKTGTFGNYSFQGLSPGTTYIISVEAKKFVIANPTRSLALLEDVSGFNFIAEPQ